MNPQRWEIPVVAPDGAFGGPVFINLPVLGEGTPVGASAPTATPDGPPSACDAEPLPTPTPDAALALPGFVVADEGDAWFVAWTEQDGLLTGTLRLTYPDPEVFGGYLSVERPFSGLRSGDQLSLTFDDDFASLTVAGTLDGHTLTLYWTDEDGMTTPVVLEAGTLAEYEQGVVTLRQEGDQDATCVAEYGATETAVATGQDAVVLANENVGRALAALEADVDSLFGATDFQFQLEGYEADWKTMKANERVFQRRVGEAPLDCFEVLYELDLLAYDLEYLAYDREAVEYIADGVGSLVADIKAGIRTLRNVYADLEAAMEANPAEAPRAGYTAAEVEQAVDEAMAQVEASETAVVEARERADQIDRAAVRLYTEAESDVAALGCADGADRDVTRWLNTNRETVPGESLLAPSAIGSIRGCRGRLVPDIRVRANSVPWRHGLTLSGS